VVAAGAASVVVDDDGPVVRGRADLGEVVVVFGDLAFGDLVFGEEGLVVVVAWGLVVDVRGVVVDVIGATASDVFEDFDSRTTLLTLVRRRIATTTAHNHHFL